MTSATVTAAVAKRGTTAAAETVKSLGGGAPPTSDTHTLPDPARPYISHIVPTRRGNGLFDAAAAAAWQPEQHCSSSSSSSSSSHHSRILDSVRLALWRCYLKPRTGNGKFVRTGMCTVFGSFSVDLTTSTSMVIHRALQVVKSVAAFGFMDLSLDSSEYCQAQHNKLDVNTY